MMIYVSMGFIFHLYTQCEHAREIDIDKMQNIKNKHVILKLKSLMKCMCLAALLKGKKE